MCCDPDGYPPAKQGSKNRKIEQRFPLVPLDQPIKVNGSGSGRNVNQTMQPTQFLPRERIDFWVEVRAKGNKHSQAKVPMKMKGRFTTS